MKELSIKDKANRYDKAIEIAKSKIKNDKDHILYEDDVMEIFPELKVSDDERIRKSLIELFHDTVSNDEIFSDYGLDKTEVLAWLEKQGEQKSVDKVESKFKVGDWITDGNSVLHITSMDSGFYQFEDSYDVKVIIDKKYHLWTIEDAKDGDVLVASDGSIFIYKYQRNNSVVHYIAVTSYNDLVINENDYSWENKNVCHPATKEQRDFLFQRIKEDGYEWDEDKKELIKL